MIGFTVFYTKNPTETVPFVLRAATEYTGNDCTYEPILRSPQGKPYFSNSALPFFSLSHTGDIQNETVTVCAVGPTQCGVDIQEHRFRGKAQDDHALLRLADRFFHPEEADFLREQQRSTPNLTPHFFDLWAAKESFVKYTGEGLRAFKTFAVTSPETVFPAVIRKIPFADCLFSSDISLFLAAEGDFSVEIKEI